MKYSHIVKKHMEKFYNGVCTIIEYDKQQGILNDIVEVIKGEQIPCRLSYQAIKSAQQSETVAQYSQIIQLFLPVDVEISAGCKVIVEQEGKTQYFNCAGESAVYGSHQEVILELEKRYI